MKPTASGLRLRSLRKSAQRAKRATAAAAPPVAPASMASFICNWFQTIMGSPDKRSGLDRKSLVLMAGKMKVQQRPMLALAVRLLAAGAIATMMLLVKLVGERGVSLTETIFWRQLLPAVVIAIWFGASGQLHRLHTPRFPSHARRAVLGLLGMFLNLGAARLLPLTEATVLGFTAPVFAVMLAAVMLGEKVGPFRWLAVGLGLSGIAIIAGPDTNAMSASGLFVGVGAAFMVALISILVRDLARTEDSISIVFWFSVINVPMLAIPMIWLAEPHDLVTWALLAGIGVVGGLGQVLLTHALRLGSVSSVIVMDYSAFGWAMVWGWLFFGHLPPTATWVGAPVIVFAGLIIVWREHRLHLQRQVAVAAD